MTVNKEILLQRIDELCKKKNINRTTAFNESGVGKNFRSNLSKCDPSEGKLTMLANYFGTTVDYLIGNTDTPEPLRSSAKNLSLTTPINDKESRLLFAYRNQPQMQPAVDKLLGISEDGETVTVYAAAQSTSDRKHVITQIPKAKWDEIENEPNTDDELL